MSPPAELLDLIERFEFNKAYHLGNKYNETQVRRKFIDPLFKLIGWDVENIDGQNETYKEVIHEDKIKIAGRTVAPDYCFRLGKVRKFFLEAKKPSLNLKEGNNTVSAAFQIRRYGWSSKLPLCILTDFEEFAIYDTRIPPKKNDHSSIARYDYFTYDQYPDKWDKIISLFAPESIINGSFEKFVVTNKVEKGAETLEDSFLAEIVKWRKLLLKNIVEKNSSLNVDELNFAIRSIIDRILFLRICEDRKIEPYGRLRGLTKGTSTYQKLIHIFQSADRKYNSGLFHFSKEKGRPTYPDILTPTLQIDDNVLKKILGNLYFPDCPYEFSVLPAEILGQVYERFLGSRITLDDKNKPEVVQKPEVKKAGGVYYTPSYIVDYIVKNTVGKLVDGKKPADVSKFRVLDPSCGSGSFLIGAYQFLLDWHLDYYLKKGTKNEKKLLYINQKGHRLLTTDERKRILINNIFGVDIDSQAVEVSKLSLLLKVLEQEDEQTLSKQSEFLQKRALPDLGQNIKCGNSLVDVDIFDRKNLSLEEDEENKINAFPWKREFSEIMNSGGFDAVIGNPPYIDSEWMTNFLPHVRNYCVPRYDAASGNWDIFCVFVEKSIRLCKRNGFSSLIVPNKLGSTDYASGARAIIANEAKLLSIRDFSKYPVFPVSIYPIVYLVQKTKSKKGSKVFYERITKSQYNTMKIAVAKELNLSEFFSKPKLPWPIFSDITIHNPTNRLSREYPPLEKVGQVLGAATVSEAYEIKKLIRSDNLSNTTALKMVNSGTIDRYKNLWSLKPIRYIKDSYPYPVIPEKYFSKLPKARLAQSSTAKIIVAGMTRFLECILDEKGEIIAGKSTSIITTSKMDYRYLLGILNSRLISFFFKTLFGGNALSGGYLRIGPPQLKRIPIKVIDFNDTEDVKRHDKVVDHVCSIQNLFNQFNQTKLDSRKKILKRRINELDKKIDLEIYKLYNLSDKEKEVIIEED